MHLRSKFSVTCLSFPKTNNCEPVTDCITKRTIFLFHLDLRRSAGPSEGDDETRLLGTCAVCVSSSETRILIIALCSDGILGVTQSTLCTVGQGRAPICTTLTHAIIHQRVLLQCKQFWIDMLCWNIALDKTRNKEASTVWMVASIFVGGSIPVAANSPAFLFFTILHFQILS